MDLVLSRFHEDVQVLPELGVGLLLQARLKLRGGLRDGRVGPLFPTGLQVDDLLVHARDAHLAGELRVEPGHDFEKDLGVAVAFLDPVLCRCGGGQAGGEQHRGDANEMSHKWALVEGTTAKDASNPGPRASLPAAAGRAETQAR